ncbi:MAG TPA: hypothetical protein VM618_02220, partial [Acidimicrobiia bacterium]|nr:hypothetical protein [Acidimicrobiia bacterium]
MASPLERGREAARRQSWSEAYEHLAAAADEAPLEVDDLERWAVSAYMLGYDEECCRIWEEAHRRCIDEGEPGEAARCSFWLALLLMFRGQEAQAGGWLARAERMVGDAARPCVAEGYLLVPPILASLAAGETDRAHELAVRATEI